MQVRKWVLWRTWKYRKHQLVPENVVKRCFDGTLQLGGAKYFGQVSKVGSSYAIQWDDRWLGAAQTAGEDNRRLAQDTVHAIIYHTHAYTHFPNFPQMECGLATCVHHALGPLPIPLTHWPISWVCVLDELIQWLHVFRNSLILNFIMFPSISIVFESLSIWNCFCSSCFFSQRKPTKNCCNHNHLNEFCSSQIKSKEAGSIHCIIVNWSN